MQNLFAVDGKVALVTGGGSGIGEMITTGYVSHGVKTYIASRKIESCQQVADALSDVGTCIPLQADLSHMDGINDLVAQIKEREDRLDILVNNSGANWGAPFDEFPESGWDKVFNVNIKAPFFLIQKLHPLLRTASAPGAPAKVINISSINGITVPDLETYSYSASKAGVIHMTRVLAKKLAPDVNVNTIAPGPFQSRMMRETLETGMERILGNVPAGRIGKPEDAAAAAIYLGSPASDFVTGAVMTLDGGMSTTV